MSVERIIWLVLAAILLVWALVVLFTTGPAISQEAVDVIQILVLCGLALGLAAKTR